MEVNYNMFIILNSSIMWDVPSDWAGGYVHMKHLWTCWKCTISGPIPDLLNQKLNFLRYPGIYRHINIWKALVWKCLHWEFSKRPDSWVTFWHHRGTTRLLAKETTRTTITTMFDKVSSLYWHHNLYPIGCSFSLWRKDNKPIYYVPPE